MHIPRTMVHQLHEQAERLQDWPALWTKKDGAYLPTSWREYARKVKHFALGLMELGFAPGQRLVIMGFNREEWLVADLAAMAAGGVPVGIYTTSSPEQIAYIVGHSEAPIALLENEGYFERLAQVREKLPKLKEVVLMEPPQTPRPGALTYEQVLRLGETADDSAYYQRVEALKADQLATLIYTSGTTGHPKGVMLSHHNLTWTTAYLSTCTELYESEVVLSYLPLSHIAEQVASLHSPLLNGMQVYFAESFEKLPENIREVRPTIFFGVPRVWEKFKAKAEASLAALPARRQRIFKWAQKVGREWNEQTLAKKNPGVVLDAQYALARRLVFSKLKERIGFDRAHVFATSAAPIGKDVLDFFCSVDMVLREVYGQSEVTGPTTVNTQRDTRLGTLGQPMPGVEVRIAEDGEILARGDNVCLGYFKDEVATKELIRDGWLHSGDVGQLDADGFLRITGRKKEIIVTSGGKKTAPANIEAYLRALEPIGHALVVGERRNYLVALLTVDPEKVEGFAKREGYPAEPKALVKDPRFRASLVERIEREVNVHLSRFEHVRKFELLAADFTIETGELTSTLKVRRKVCEAKYADLIEQLYGEPAPGAKAAAPGGLSGYLRAPSAT